MPAFGGLLRDPIGSTLYWEIKSRWQEFLVVLVAFVLVVAVVANSGGLTQES